MTDSAIATIIAGITATKSTRVCSAHNSKLAFTHIHAPTLCYRCKCSIAWKLVGPLWQIQYNTKFVKRHVAVASDTLANRTGLGLYHSTIRVDI